MNGGVFYFTLLKAYSKLCLCHAEVPPVPIISGKHLPSDSSGSCTENQSIEMTN